MWTGCDLFTTGYHMFAFRKEEKQFYVNSTQTQKTVSLWAAKHYQTSLIWLCGIGGTPVSHMCHLNSLESLPTRSLQCNVKCVNLTHSDHLNHYWHMIIYLVMLNVSSQHTESILALLCNVKCQSQHILITSDTLCNYYDKCISSQHVLIIWITTVTLSLIYL